MVRVKNESSKELLKNNLTIQQDKASISNRISNPRNIQPIAPNNTVKKIMAVAFIAFLLCGVFIPFIATSYQLSSPGSTNAASLHTKDCSQVPLYLCPYSSELANIVPPQSHSIGRFPNYLDKAVHPGFISTPKGYLCQIQKKTDLSFKECEKLVDEAAENIQSEMPDTYEMITAPSEKGFGILISTESGSPLKVTFGMDARKITNQKKALQYLEKKVLNDPDFFEKGEEELIRTIKKTHEIILEKLSSSAGKFRKDSMIVRDDQTELTIPGLKKALAEKGGTNEDKKHLDSLLRKSVKSDGSLVIDIKKINAKEKAAFSKIAFIACPHEEVENKITLFATELKEMAVKIKAQEIDPIAVAAYVHQQIGNIHPFDDANGRTARIWMNTMLQLGGHKAVVIPNDSEYTEAVVNDQKTPGTFTAYLEEIIEWNLQRKSFH